MGGVVGFSSGDMLDLLLNGTTVDQLLDIFQKRLMEMMTPQWIM